MQRAYAPLLKPLGLTYAGYLTLLALWASDDLSVGEIGRSLYLDSGTLTPVLRRLEAQGYVERRRSVRDEREVRITLTAKGSALEHEVGPLRAAIARKTGLETPALVALRTELRALHTRLTDVERDSGAAGDEPHRPLPS